MLDSGTHPAHVFLEASDLGLTTPINTDRREVFVEIERLFAAGDGHRYTDTIKLVCDRALISTVIFSFIQSFICSG